MAHADVAEGIEDAFVRHDTIGGGEIAKQIDECVRQVAFPGCAFLGRVAKQSRNTIYVQGDTPDSGTPRAGQ
jgi:hypothetical protein